MATIYLKHPIHGQKVAVLEEEAQQDERSGWTRYNPHKAYVEAPMKKEAYVEVSESVASADCESMNDLVERYTAKFGKKPHWKMKPEGIRKALET